MLNKSGITTTPLTNTTQILANVELQASVGCVVDDAIVAAADANGKKIAKAGTPIVVDFSNLQTPVVAPNPEASPATVANAVLLHDVDVTSGDANGTALYFGVVNINRLDEATQAKVTAGVNTIGAVTFIKA
jgi:hypothetical protein